VCGRECVRECACVCVRESERERECVCASMCLRVYVCLCVNSWLYMCMRMTFYWIAMGCYRLGYNKHMFSCNKQTHTNTHTCFRCKSTRRMVATSFSLKSMSNPSWKAGRYTPDVCVCVSMCVCVCVCLCLCVCIYGTRAERQVDTPLQCCRVILGCHSAVTSVGTCKWKALQSVSRMLQPCHKNIIL
jgi:hypothetical protein